MPHSLQSCFPWMVEDEDEAHSEKPAMQFCVRTPSPPLFRARHPAPSPATYLPAGRCTPEPELLPQPMQSRNPAPQHRWRRVSPPAVNQVSATEKLLCPQTTFSLPKIVMYPHPTFPCC